MAERTCPVPRTSPETSGLAGPAGNLWQRRKAPLRQLHGQILNTGTWRKYHGIYGVKALKRNTRLKSKQLTRLWGRCLPGYRREKKKIDLEQVEAEGKSSGEGGCPTKRDRSHLGTQLEGGDAETAFTEGSTCQHF